MEGRTHANGAYIEYKSMHHQAGAALIRPAPAHSGLRVHAAGPCSHTSNTTCRQHMHVTHVHSMHSRRRRSFPAQDSFFRRPQLPQQRRTVPPDCKFPIVSSLASSPLPVAAEEANRELIIGGITRLVWTLGTPPGVVLIRVLELN